MKKEKKREFTHVVKVPMLFMFDHIQWKPTFDEILSLRGTLGCIGKSVSISSAGNNGEFQGIYMANPTPEKALSILSMSKGRKAWPGEYVTVEGFGLCRVDNVHENTDDNKTKCYADGEGHFIAVHSSTKKAGVGGITLRNYRKATVEQILKHFERKEKRENKDVVEGVTGEAGRRLNLVNHISRKRQFITKEEKDLRDIKDSIKRLENYLISKTKPEDQRNSLIDAVNEKNKEKVDTIFGGMVGKPGVHVKHIKWDEFKKICLDLEKKKFNATMHTSENGDVSLTMPDGSMIVCEERSISEQKKQRLADEAKTETRNPIGTNRYTGDVVYEEEKWEPKYGEVIQVYDDDQMEFVSRTFVAKVDTELPYLCVMIGCEDEFKSGGSFSVHPWYFAKKR